MFEMSLPERDPGMRYGYNTVRYSLDDWARFPEVILFADRNGVSFGEAIKTLVNSGLSHLHQPFEGRDIKEMTERVKKGMV